MQRVIYINHLASNPQQAYFVARMLMRATNIMAHPAGQYLRTYKCDKIEEYYLNAANEKCNKINTYSISTNKINTYSISITKRVQAIYLTCYKLYYID